MYTAAKEALLRFFNSAQAIGVQKNSATRFVPNLDAHWNSRGQRSRGGGGQGGYRVGGRGGHGGQQSTWQNPNTKQGQEQTKNDKTTMKKAGAKINLVDDEIELFGNKVKMGSTSSGHYTLPIKDLVDKTDIASQVFMARTDNPVYDRSKSSRSTSHLVIPADKRW